MSLILSLLFVGCVAGAFAPILSSEKGRRGFLLALRSLWLHKLRSFLSVLGIIIGNVAVVTLMAFGEGSMQDTLNDIRRLGATNLIVRSIKPPDDSASSNRGRAAVYGLTYDDFERFQTIGSVIRMVPMRVFPQEARKGPNMITARVVATTPEYASVNTLEFASGGFFNDVEDEKMLNRVVIGSDVAEKLFPYGDPLHQEIGLGKNNTPYTVVGVLKDRMPTGGSNGGQGESFNADIYIPLETSKGRVGQRLVNRKAGNFSAEEVQLHQVTLTLGNEDQVRPGAEVVRELLEMYHGKKKDWGVEVPLDRLQQAERAKERFTSLLWSIASVSLLVGGIGIMNIMLATVTERTREIGIRRALGAKRRDITLQFLIEAMVQTTMGGLIGVALGLAAVVVVPPVWGFLTASNLPALVHVPSIFISLAVSVAVGVGFGYYPAWKAARLDPIEALRHV